jgi:hypothetical protein
VNTGRTSPIDAIARRRFSASQIKAMRNTIVNSVPWLRSIVEYTNW